VAAGEQCGVVTEERLKRFTVELGQEHVVVGARRAVEEKQRNAVELAANDWSKGQDLFEVRRGES
jgi:hypothetical protein